MGLSQQDGTGREGTFTHKTTQSRAVRKLVWLIFNVTKESFIKVVIIIPNLFNETQIKGIKCELQCALKLIEKGFIVSVPYGNTSRYDLVIDAGNNKFFRIQCKTASQNENGSYTIQTSNQQFTATARNIKHYTKEQIDFICSIVENQLVVIPVSLIETSKSKVFRSHTYPPKNNSAVSTCNWIDDYTVENQILPLL